MIPLSFVLPLFAQLAIAGVQGRPPECGLLPGERGANVWERAKVPELRPYCDLLASASAKLTPGSRMVREVVGLADQAESLVPGRAAAPILRGRALAALGRYPEAVSSLKTAVSRDARALDEPSVLLAWASSLAATGDTDGARAAYGALLPRAESLPLADRGVAYLGAGMLSMSLGPKSVNQTIAILRQARQDSQGMLRSASTFALALALDRAGDAGEATAVLTEEGPSEVVTVMAEPRVVLAMGTAGKADVPAIEALAFEATGKTALARTYWATYVAAAGAGGAWDAATKRHVGAAGKAGHP
jgi:tetratricopeptide (TPR) repeat protein